jgi:hypothetical protein
MWEDDADEAGGVSYRSVEQFDLKMGSKFNLMTRRQVHFLEFQVQYTISQLVKYTVNDRKFATM